MDHAFINIPEVDNFRPRLMGSFFKWVSRFLHLRPFLMTQVKLIGKGYKRATNSHYRKSSKNDSRFFFLANQERGIHIQMELVPIKSEAIFVRIPIVRLGVSDDE